MATVTVKTDKFMIACINVGIGLVAISIGVVTFACAINAIVKMF